jgi:acetoacetyl-CoA synthetase
MTVDKPIWTPPEDAQRQSNLGQFIEYVQRKSDVEVHDYQALYKWSVDSPDKFWSALAAYCDIKFDSPAEHILTQPGDMQTARWFKGATLNFAANLLADEEESGDSTTAIIFCDERGRRKVLSRTELRVDVAALAAGMRKVGIQPGDRVAAMLPNCPEAVMVMLAAASIGAVFSSCSPDFGVQAVMDRFGQITPRLLFVCDGYGYAGKRINCCSKAASVAAAIPTIEHVIVVPFLDAEPDIEQIERASLFDDFSVAGSEPDYTSLPFNHPLYIVFSSGTTGKPKCIVHGAGGTLLQHKKELMLHTDLRAGEVIFYFTTCGWMMWNWLVSALAVKASVVLYDGSPFYPDSSTLLHMAAQEDVAVFGTSPRYLTALQKDKTNDPANSLAKKLPALRTLLSTGAPLAAGSYDYIQTLFAKHIQICSISGGTDLISCFALGNPLLPVYRGELQCRGLGMAVEVFNDHGESLSSEVGELVCTQAFPSMPLGFWNDKGGAYTAAYFQRFPGVWAHGDLAELTVHDGLKIYGRSDAVLNPGGVRIGTAEVCEPVMGLAEIVDCIAVGQRQGADSRIVLFVVVHAACELDAKLEQKIRDKVKVDSSARHVPEKILAVPEIPRTLSGKAVELAVRAVIHGEPVENIDVLANPGSLEHFSNRPELAD